jgi:prepilin-type N-terminal cleavage/methylation domain-containing protein
MTSRRTKELGFTLIELMIATAILGVVTSQVFMVMNTQKRVYISSERVLDVQEDSRTVLDLLTFDTRMAGFMVPEPTGVSSFDGGAANPDSLCISDSSYFDFPTGGAPSDALDIAAEHFDASGIPVALQAASVTVTTLDIDSDNGANDFGVGRGVIISDGVRSHCARILTNVGNQITFTPNIPFPGNYVQANVRVVPAIIYELNANGNPNANQLTRNGLMLSSAVEDLQVEYWVDNSALGNLNGVIDDATEFPIDDLNNPPGPQAMDTSAIRRIRISVITVTDQNEGAVSRLNLNQQRPASANRAAGIPDAFKRRRFTTSILPRNLL